MCVTSIQWLTDPAISGELVDATMANMELDSLNEMLEELGEANDGANHGSSYSLEPLPSADSLQAAVDTYFSEMYPESWNIHITELTEPPSDLADAAHVWFYGQEFSPLVDNATAQRTVQEFMNRLHAVIGSAARVYAVQVRPPRWYECLWQDFVMDGESTRWFLHFGFSD